MKNRMRKRAFTQHRLCPQVQLGPFWSILWYGNLDGAGEGSSQRYGEIARENWTECCEPRRVELFTLQYQRGPGWVGGWGGGGGGRVLIIFFGVSVRPGPENPYLVSDQNLRFSLPYCRPDSQNVYPISDPVRCCNFGNSKQDLQWQTPYGTSWRVCAVFFYTLRLKCYTRPNRRNVHPILDKNGPVSD